MPISGYAITLAEDEATARDSLEVMARDARLEIGPREGRRVAAVGETPTTDDDRALWEWLNDLPGVAHVDVVFVELDEPAEEIDMISHATLQQRGER